LPAKFSPAPSYTIGIIATWWFLDRVLGMFGWVV